MLPSKFFIKGRYFSMMLFNESLEQMLNCACGPTMYF